MVSPLFAPCRPLCDLFEGWVENCSNKSFEANLARRWAWMRAQGRCEKKQEKDLALYCARSITTARSAGSLRGFQITLFYPKRKRYDTFSF